MFKRRSRKGSDSEKRRTGLDIFVRALINGFVYSVKEFRLYPADNK